MESQKNEENLILALVELACVCTACPGSMWLFHGVKDSITERNPAHKNAVL